MKIPFADIGESGIRRVVKGTGWCSQLGYSFPVVPEVKISLFRAEDASIVLDGNLQISVDMLCSRCGCEMVLAVDEEFSYTFVLEEGDRHFQAEKECSEEDIETVYLDVPEIDVDEVLREQLILSIPEKPLCSEQCKGVCHKCGASLNTRQCGCDEGEKDSPFAVLKHLKK